VTRETRRQALLVISRARRTRRVEARLALVVPSDRLGHPASQPQAPNDVLLLRRGASRLGNPGPEFARAPGGRDGCRIVAGGREDPIPAFDIAQAVVQVRRHCVPCALHAEHGLGTLPPVVVGRLEALGHLRDRHAQLLLPRCLHAPVVRQDHEVQLQALIVKVDVSAVVALLQEERRTLMGGARGV
jgi:hypothetical protein